MLALLIQVIGMSKLRAKDTPYRGVSSFVKERKNKMGKNDNDYKDFYPTPETLIDKMLSSIDFKMVQTILEPSAGTGNIVAGLEKHAKASYYRNREELDIDCIEKNQNMRHILKGKGMRVVHDDFLTYQTMKEYDLIVMNPPFSNGCLHLLKALEMQERNGGAVICLLNSETLKNECSNDRIVLNQKLKQFNASVEYIRDAFVDAERKTNVEVALIKVVLPQVERHSFIMERLEKAKQQQEVFADETYSVVENDFLKAIVKQYQLEVEAGVKLIHEFNAMKPLILSEFKKDKHTGETIQCGSCMLKLGLNNYYSTEATINGYIKEVRIKYWTALFSNPLFIGKLTINLQEEYYSKIGELANYDFTLYNIYELKIDMNKNITKGIADTIIALFDEFSHKHYYYDETGNNIHYYNGWKTNSAYMVNKKVIIPLSGFYTYSYDNSKEYRPSRQAERKLADIEKCFSYLDGGLTEAVDLSDALIEAEKTGITKNISLRYFNVTFYKKGTCHITFTNDDLLKKFNIFGSQQKGWLPPSYGKKQYAEMSKEEQEVINDFQGEVDYAKVMKNTKYFITDTNNFLLEEKVC